MFETVKPFLLSLALGLAIGVERERAHGGPAARTALGARTFTLIALLGTLAAHVTAPGIAIALAAFVALAVVASYLRPMEDGTHDAGATTEVAAMATFALGWLAHQEPRLAVLIAVLVLGVLWSKARVHAFAHEGLTDAEVKSALTFGVIALVVLPILPDHAVDPWGIFVPQRLWLLFTLIAGTGFAGYIAVRAVGPARGLAAAGFAAGLVSSTAATLSLSQRARREPSFAGPLATGIVLANVASATVQILVAGVADPEILPKVAAFIAPPVLTGIAATLLAVWWLGRRESGAPGAAFELKNPLELRAALVMAAIFAVILAISAVAARWLGSAGVLATSAIAGLTDVHAATLAAATLARAGTIAPADALTGILIAFLVNMTVKLGIVGFVAGRRLAIITAPPLLAMAAAAVVAYVVSTTGR